MSLDKYASLYEKMLEKPENRVRSFMKQPMPGDIDGINTPVAEAVVPDEDEAWIREVDQRVVAKKSGVPPIVNEGVSLAENRITKLEKEINELKELMTTMMKTHMKLLGRYQFENDK